MVEEVGCEVQCEKAEDPLMRNQMGIVHCPQICDFPRSSPNERRFMLY